MTISRIEADFTYRLDQIEPAMGFLWLAGDETPWDFSNNPSWVFRLEVVSYANVIVATIPDGQITGSDQSPNVVVELAADQWAGLVAARYMLHLAAWQDAARPMLMNEGFWPTLELTPIPTP